VPAIAARRSRVPPAILATIYVGSPHELPGRSYENDSSARFCSGCRANLVNKAASRWTRGGNR